MLKATNLGKYYIKDNYLFRGLDLEVPPGHIMAVLGPNARGKTTLLKTLSHLLEPSEGSVYTDGLVGYVPQSKHTSVSFPVIDMVMMGRASKMKAWETPGKKEKEIALNSLEKVGIAHLAQKSYGELSGGQKQLVLIARAIATDPKTLVLDEPTSALDLKNQMLVLEICSSLAQSSMGIILTTHDPSHAALIADSLLCMPPEGRVEHGGIKQLLTGEKLSELYGTHIVVDDITVQEQPHVVVVPVFHKQETYVSV
ncbi:MAG: ABC transporter ATP-binding protein [Actinomycetaceae bacterium]|nr:ABC transporter ATP-binding protein [Actinomycetaceae bacterium]